MPIHHTFGTTCAPCESPIARMVAEQSVPAIKQQPDLFHEKVHPRRTAHASKDTSDVAERLIALAKTCREIIALC